MKRILNIVLLAVFALATIACDKDNISATYTQESANTMSLSGASALSFQLGLEESSATYQLDQVQINRANGQGDVTVNLVTAVSGNATVTVDPVTFTNGQTQATTKMSISNVELGSTVTVKVSIPEANLNPIEGSASSFTITVKRSKPASWIPVTTKSIFKNGLIGMFTIDPDGQYAPYCTYPVYVEKRSDADIFRVKNVAKSENFALSEPGDDIEGDSWMVIDATDPKNVSVARFPLQIDWGSGPIYAGTFDAYGYPDDPRGTYDPATGIITFPYQTMGCDMPDYGTSIWYCFETILYLDENTMGTDFNRDYTFMELSSTITLMDMTRGRGSKSIYVGVPNDESKTQELIEKHGHVFAIPNYMARDYNIYFAVNEKGTFALPEEYASQEFGVQLLNGVDLYMNITKASSFDLEKGILTLVYDLVTNDGVTIKTFSDVFYMEGDEVTAADYVGEYVTDSDETPVSITDIPSMEMLAVSGVTKEMELPFKYNSYVSEDQSGNEVVVPLNGPALYPNIYGDIFCGIFEPNSEKYYLLEPTQTFDLIMTATGVVAVIPTEIAYELQLEICFAKLNAQGQLTSPSYYDFRPMVFIPTEGTELNVSEMKPSATVNMKDDNSNPLVNNAKVNGQKIVVIEKEAADKNSVNKSRVVNR